MHDRPASESDWNTSDFLASQESIDCAGERDDLEFSRLAPFWELVSQLSAVDKTTVPRDSAEVGAWAQSLKGATLGRFVIDDLIGHGGFGVVFRAFDPELKRFVAIKIPRPDVLARRGARQRFLEEARVAAMLRHPGIVQVHDTGCLGPLVFIASELCSGETLRDWMLSRVTSISPTLAASIVLQLADSVGYAHTRGVIHQDLKPGNVLIDHSVPVDESTPGNLRVTDFGLACRLEAQGETPETQAGGTRHYMAPEQRNGDTSQIGTHTDVYALGVILGELLQGELQVSDEVTARRESDSPIPIAPTTPKRTRIPRDLWAIFLKCTLRNPADRYSHAGDLQADLQRFLNHEPVTARNIGIAERSALWIRRRPLVASLLVTMALGALVALAVIFRQWQRAQVNFALATQQARLADDRLRDAEALLVRVSWALDEMFFFDQRKYTVDSNFLDELARDLTRFVLHRQDQHQASLPAVAAALWRQGYDSYEQGDFVSAERLAKESADIWMGVLRTEPQNRVYRRSAAMTIYYLAVYRLSAGIDPQQLFDLENGELIPGFSWQSVPDVQLAEELTSLLHSRSLAIAKLPNPPDKRTSHYVSRLVWQQLAEHAPSSAEHRFASARELGLMGQCDRADGKFELARSELLQAAMLLEELFEQPDMALRAREQFVRFHQAASKCSMRLEDWAEALESIELAIHELSDPAKLKLKDAEHRVTGLKKSAVQMRKRIAAAQEN